MSERIKIARLGALTRDESIRLRRQITKLRSAAQRYGDDKEVTIAYVDGRVLGYWVVGVPYTYNSKIAMHSCYTHVQNGFRRRGVARKLWDYGISFWKPDVVHASVGSFAGWKFLKSSVLKYARVGVLIDIIEAGEYPDIYKEIVKDSVSSRARRPDVTSEGRDRSGARSEPTTTKVH